MTDKGQYLPMADEADWLVCQETIRARLAERGVKAEAIARVLTVMGGVHDKYMRVFAWGAPGACGECTQGWVGKMAYHYIQRMRGMFVEIALLEAGLVRQKPDRRITRWGPFTCERLQEGGWSLSMHCRTPRLWWIIVACAAAATVAALVF